ncbi:hypothetical protein QUB75_15145 [Microcoleus sp. K1-B6]|uniref:hypothetical protein n=1 Tax=Microcoleus sp. K1-B1 TaxID=2818782 RepID=UPI002FD27067
MFLGRAREVERTIRILKLHLLHGASVGAIAQCVITHILHHSQEQARCLFHKE